MNRGINRRERRSPWRRDLADTAGFLLLFAAIVWGLPSIPALARLLERVLP